MLNEITCDTEIGSLLKVSDVTDLVDSIQTTIENYHSTIDDELEWQLTSGGLSEEALCIDSEYPLNISGQATRSNLSEITSSFSTYKEQIVSRAEEQRKAEIERLKQKVSEKISQLSTEIFSHQLLLRSSSVFNNNVLVSNHTNIIRDLEEKKEYYSNKLKQIEGLV